MDNRGLSGDDWWIIRRCQLIEKNFVFDKINQTKFVFIVTARVMLLLVVAHKV